MQKISGKISLKTTIYVKKKYTKTLYQQRLTHTLDIFNINIYTELLLQTSLLQQNLSSSSLCDFCAMDIESIEHRFWQCSYTQLFWRDLIEYFKKKINIEINLKTIYLFYLQSQIHKKMQKTLFFWWQNITYIVAKSENAHHNLTNFYIIFGADYVLKNVLHLIAINWKSIFKNGIEFSQIRIYNI
jgi:hypothetical protein